MRTMTHRFALFFVVAFTSKMMAQTPCVDGFAGDYPCEGLELLSVRSLEELGGGANGNDCWGWVDPESGREFVLYGRANGLSIVDVTDAVNPIFMANVPTTTESSLWRDVKVHDNHAFIVSEADFHGMQVVDLTQIPDLDTSQVPVELGPIALYSGFGSAHNIVMNEASGFAYAVGTNSAGGGLHVIDVNDPAEPVIAGTFDESYTHDAQVVIYEGPDTAHIGKEVAFCFNGNSGVAIVDVTDKTDMTLMSSFSYTQQSYTHQGWLSEDQSFVYFNDELDEQEFGHGTRTYIANVSDLENPVVMGYYQSENTSVDHNLYIRGDKVFASNYMSGLRVMTILPDGQLEPHAHFDVRPDSDTATFYGTWSNYPYFPSGNIAISCRLAGLFMVRDPQFVPTQLADDKVVPAAELTVHPNPSRGIVKLSGMAAARRYRVLNLVGQEVRSWQSVPGLEGLHLDVSDLGPGIFLLQAQAETGTVQTVRFVVGR